MCGRYTISVDPAQLAARFDAALPSEPITPRYNAAPSQNLPTLLNEGERRIELLHWGLIPHWAKDPAIGSKMINARAETLEEKPSFRDALKKRRCLVLADGFYEWQAGTGKTKTPMRITLKSGDPFAFAGLWENWKDENGEWLRSFTIITTAPNELMEPIHNRMPAILKPSDEAVWLDNEAGLGIWKNLLKSYPADLMTAYPVSKRVNAVSADDPALMTPA